MDTFMALASCFVGSPEFDYIVTQPDGAMAIMLYLSMGSVLSGSNGVLCEKVGSMTIPLSKERLHRMFTWVPLNKMDWCLDILQKAGLLTRMDNGMLRCSGPYTRFEPGAGAPDWEALADWEEPPEGAGPQCD